MTFVARLAVILVGLLHFGFMVLEMFYWDHPIGRQIFEMTPQQSAATALLAANQGLYNGFLGAGLLWAAFTKRREVKLFFLMCVIIAGVFAASMTDGGTLRVQALPGAVALALVLLTPSKPRAKPQPAAKPAPPVAPQRRKK